MNWRRALPYVWIAIGAALYLFPFMRVQWRVGDEGSLVYGAQRVAEGSLPYRDFFEVMGPASFYWLGFFFKIFGAHLIVARALLLLTGAASALLAYWLAERLRPRSGALPAVFLLVIGIPLWPATNHHWDSNLFALLSFAVFVWRWDRLRPGVAFAAGLLAGITSMFMLQKGMALAISYLLVLLISRRRNPGWLRACGALSAGYASVVAIVAGCFFSAGALPDLLYANVIWPATRYSGVNSVPYAYGLFTSNPANWNAALSSVSSFAAYALASFSSLPLLLVAALPFLLAGAAILGRTAVIHRATLPYWIAGFALWFSEFHRADITHLTYGCPLLLILIACLWSERPGRFWKYGLRTMALSLLLLAAFHAFNALGARVQTATRRGTIYTFTNDSALDFLDHQVKAGQDVFVFPYYPMYYFLSGTSNPTRYSILMYGINTEAQFQDAVSSLERKKVRYVLWDTLVDGPHLRRWFPGYRHPADDKLIMERYLNERYDVIAIKNGFRVLERKQALPAAPHCQPAPAESAAANLVVRRQLERRLGRGAITGHVSRGNGSGAPAAF